MYCMNVCDRAAGGSVRGGEGRPDLGPAGCERYGRPRAAQAHATGGGSRAQPYPSPSYLKGRPNLAVQDCHRLLLKGMTSLNIEALALFQTSKQRIFDDAPETDHAGGGAILCAL